ncbi:hypothetical protein BC835DRAFT_482890 [Cytidiella melzeri]|nr:hypothetical protein BC835DRAFT_482890 [Cytidiella melzeri]
MKALAKVSEHVKSPRSRIVRGEPEDRKPRQQHKRASTSECAAGRNEDRRPRILNARSYAASQAYPATLLPNERCRSYTKFLSSAYAARDDNVERILRHTAPDRDHAGMRRIKATDRGCFSLLSSHAFCNESVLGHTCRNLDTLAFILLYMP